MASQVQICNMTLLRVGAPPILSIDDDSKRARCLRDNWDLVLDLVLREHTWNFATRRSNLARLSAAPAFGWDYAYQLPVACLRVLGLVSTGDEVDPSIEYNVEGDQLLTNEETAYLKYIERVTNTGYFDAGFASALASRLAAEVAYYLTNSVALQEHLTTMYHKIELPGARAMDAQENPPQVYEDLTWDDARA